MEKVKTHKDLILWQKSVNYVTTVYEVTSSFPKEEVYGITNQIRRAAVSIPSNIAEGSARKSQKEYLQFLYIALGSIMELDTQLIISNNLSYLNDKSFKMLSEDLTELSKMTSSLIRNLSANL
jgi:four helix bundle protein